MGGRAHRELRRHRHPSGQWRRAGKHRHSPREQLRGSGPTPPRFGRTRRACPSRRPSIATSTSSGHPRNTVRGRLSTRIVVENTKDGTIANNVVVSDESLPEGLRRRANGRRRADGQRLGRPRERFLSDRSRRVDPQPARAAGSHLHDKACGDRIRDNRKPPSRKYAHHYHLHMLPRGPHRRMGD